MTIKIIDDYININIVNPLYLIIGKADGYIEENNENKYLIFFFQLMVIKKYQQNLQNFGMKLKHVIEIINESKKSEYEKYLLK